MSPLGPIDPDLAALLSDDRAAVGAEEAPEATKRAVLDRVELSIAGIVASSATGAAIGSALGGAPAGAAKGLGAHVLSNVLSTAGGRAMIGVATLLVGATGGAVAMRAYDVQDRAGTAVSPVTPATAAAPAATASAPPPPGAVAPAAPATSAFTEEPAVAPAPARPATPQNASSVPTLDDEAAERRLLDDARAALGRGEGERAIATLSSHSERFPRGRLAEERDALVIQAFARTSRVPEARTRAARFETKYPNSLLLPAIRDAVGSNSDK